MEKVLRFGRMMFIYDTECCQREEDDPAEAICFLQCSGGAERPSDDSESVDSDALHLVCQLMGTALFTEMNMASFPTRIRLHHGEFVLYREANFIWVMHTSGEDETYVTRRQLTRTRQALRLLHGGVSALLSAAGGDRAALRRRLGRTLGPLVAGAGPQPPLERVFDVLPRLDWAQKDDFIAQQLSEVQTAALRVPGALACVLCWDAQVLSNDDIEDFVEVLVHIHWLPEDAYDLVDVEFVMPPGTMLARVHVPSELHTTLRRVAESQWLDAGSDKSVPSSASPAQRPLNVIEEGAEATGGGGGGGSGGGGGGGGGDTGTGTGTSTGTSGTASHTSSTQDGTDSKGKENRPASGRRRRRRRRLGPSQTEPPAEEVPAVPPAADVSPTTELESPGAVRHRISALALQALSAECGRAEPPPPPPVDQIPVRRLRRPRAGRPRRGLADLDVPEPFSNLAYLKRRQPELYRDELRKLQVTLPDNQPAFTAVSANPYSFGIPRSNRLYTPRPAGAGAGAAGEPPVPGGRGVPWRPARGLSAGYASESPRVAGSPRGPGPGRRFFSDGEEAGGWRPRQLAALLSDGGATCAPAEQPVVVLLTTARLYTRTCGKLKCHVLLEERQDDLHGLVQQLDRVTGAGLLELESMLCSYRSIPSFHGQHYSYAAVRSGGGGGRQLESEGAAHLDCRLIQMVHADLLAGRLTDCRIRTPSDVLLAQRSGQLETYYQQRTSGHQHGLPVVNGPLSRLDDRARKRLGENHGLMLG